MHISTTFFGIRKISTAFLAVFLLLSCEEDDSKQSNAAIFLIIDEESIDNGNEPNNFSEVDVNDQLADIGQRQPLKYFEENVGKMIDLYTGQVGDEGWFAPRTIPDTWIAAGPTDNGVRNYLTPGPGLGAAFPDDDREVLLDEIPDVVPLRATGLSMLVGETIYAVVYDSDVSINYSPLKGNLQGANLGIVAFEVIGITARTDGSDSDLPKVSIRIVDVDAINTQFLALFMNAPVPESSSEPFDITPPESFQPIQVADAP